MPIFEPSPRPQQRTQQQQMQSQYSHQNPNVNVTVNMNIGGDQRHHGHLQQQALHMINDKQKLKEAFVIDA